MSVFVCGTDTDVGKTLASALVLRNLAREQADPVSYWKPVQTGQDDDDSRTVSALTDLPEERVLPKLWHLRKPLSPHRAAELEQKEIRLEELIQAYRNLSRKHGRLLIEGAGGLLVPLNRKETWLDFLCATKLPVLLVARSGLGTINHSLLTLRCLQESNLSVRGVIFFGAPNPDNVRTVCEFSKLPCLGAFDYLPASASQQTGKRPPPSFKSEDFSIWHKWASFRDIFHI